MSEIEEETPIQAISRIKLSRKGLQQQIKFYYDDPTEIYYSYVKAELEDELITEITNNMQDFLAQDMFKLNDKEIPLLIIDTSLDFDKNKRTKPVIEFIIRNGSELFFRESGIQTILLEAEKEILDYPITSLWKFPGKIASIESPLHYKITGFNVIFTADQGTEIGGTEIFTFHYKIRL